MGECGRTDKSFLKNKRVGKFFSFFLDIVWMHIGCAVAQN
jgi:hypothetical protein